MHERLAGVTIECLPYAEFIERYDRPETLFYCDPPYWGAETDYGRDIFSRDDFERLAGLLRAIKGRFVLSINDVPEIRTLFEGLDIQPVTLTYSVAEAAATEAKELIITNRHVDRPVDRAGDRGRGGGGA